MYVLIYYIILASNFKPMRGLNVKMAEELLESVVDMELSIQEMATECKEIKRLRDIQDEFVRQTGSSSWEEAEHKFPAFATTEVLMNSRDVNSQSNAYLRGKIPSNIIVTVDA